MNKKILSLLFCVVVSLVISGCAEEKASIPEPVLAETSPSSPKIVEEATAIPDESPPMEGEANNLTDITPQQQDVTVNQPAMQETKVQKPGCSREFSPQFNAGPYYEGALFDAHFHMPSAWEEEPDIGFNYPVLGKDITFSQILCYFDEEKVRGAITFNLWQYENLEQSIQNLAERKKQSPEGIHLFLIPSELGAEELDDIVTSHQGLFDGFGEISHYSPERSGQTPDDPVSLETYRVAAKHGLIIMFHPGKNQKSKVENALQKNPDVKFLLHGPEAEDYITDLITKYPNAYYSIDTLLISLPDPHLPNSRLPLMYTVSDKEEFKLKFTKNFDVMLNDAVNRWKPRIEQHPDRFMWGTDRAADWHFNEEVSILVEEFTRAFTGRLAPEVQEKYAHKNAERLIEISGEDE